MSHLQVGDSIRSASGFSTVYGFGHGIESTFNLFVRLETMSGHSIELTAFHQVFVGTTTATSTKYAKNVQVGDSLILKDNMEDNMVTSVSMVHKNGLYAPFTEDGTLFVNGVLASQNSQSPNVAVAGIELISMHKFKFMVYAPSRILCGLGPSTILCAHDKENRLWSLTAIWSIIEALVPGVMEEDETLNFLSLDCFFVAKVLFLFGWILPIYLLEQAGLAATVTAMCGFYLYYYKHQHEKYAKNQCNH